MMNVLFISRPTLFSTPGGDTVQMEKTKEYLEKNFDIQVSIETELASINYIEYDLIHFFNIIRPNNILPHLPSGLPYVVSPIYVDYSEYDQEARGGVFGKLSKLFGKGRTEYLKSIARWVKNGENPGAFYYLVRGYNKSIEKVLKNCRVVLPNSNSELNRLKNDFAFSSKSVVVPNAVDTSKFRELIGGNKSGVICVARIEGRKNQLNLIRAIKKTDIRLTIIGKPSPNHIGYYNQCRNEANDQVSFVDHINQEELRNYYSAARVHAMVSWFETTGLSSLEAAACGANLVISDKGDQREYFGDDVFYADPDNVDSIKDAIIKAYKTKPSQKLLDRIRNEYNWEQTAKQTMSAYKFALKERK